MRVIRALSHAAQVTPNQWVGSGRMPLERQDWAASPNDVRARRAPFTRHRHALPVSTGSYRPGPAPLTTHTGDAGCRRRVNRALPIGQNPQVAAHPRARRKDRCGPGRFSYRVGQGLEIIIAVDVRSRLTFDPDDCPASRDGHTVRVSRAKIIGMRLGERREWAQHRRRFDVGIREGGDGGSAAGRPRAAPGHHRANVSSRTAQKPHRPAVSRTAGVTFAARHHRWLRCRYGS